jgi:hypothetical protein
MQAFLSAFICGQNIFSPNFAGAREPVDMYRCPYGMRIQSGKRLSSKGSFFGRR